MINPNKTDYEHYGGRGIEFRFKSFEEWFKEVGKKPSSGHTIDRINNDGHYEVGNVRWATVTEQNHNIRKNRRITVRGKEGLLIDAVNAYGLTGDVMNGRFTDGWCGDCIVSKPKFARCPHIKKRTAANLPVISPCF